MRARELLDRHRPRPDETDLRGFEWHYLRRLFHRDRLTVNAHAGYALMVAYLPDGKRLISYGTSQRPPAGEFNNSLPGELKLWDTTTGGQLPLQLKGPTDNVACAALSPDGKQLAAGYVDKTVRVWDLETSEGIRAAERITATIFRVQFSPDGRRLVSVAADTQPPHIPLGDSSERAEGLGHRGPEGHHRLARTCRSFTCRRRSARTGSYWHAAPRSGP